MCEVTENRVRIRNEYKRSSFKDGFNSKKKIQAYEAKIHQRYNNDTPWTQLRYEIHTQNKVLDTKHTEMLPVSA